MKQKAAWTSLVVERISKSNTKDILVKKMLIPNSQPIATIIEIEVVPKGAGPMSYNKEKIQITPQYAKELADKILIVAKSEKGYLHSSIQASKNSTLQQDEHSC